MADKTTKSGAEFAKLMQKVLLKGKESRWSVKAVAAAMGMKEATFRSRFNAEERRTYIAPEEIKALIKAAPDMQFINYFLDETPYVAVERAPETPEGGKDPKLLRARADITVEEAADVIRQVRLAFQDDKVCHIDQRRILAEVRDLERAVAALKVSV